MKKILISGYYGFGNSGDDALLLSIISDFKDKGLGDCITVLSSNPTETEKNYGVKAVNRINPFAVILNLLSCRLFITGGGTLIQDGTSTKSLLYYLSLIVLAKVFRKKTMLYANGIGPVNKPKNRDLCKKILSGVEVITVRDKKSVAELENMGITKPEIALTADPVFLLKPDNTSDVAAGEEYICVSVRSTKNMSADFTGSISRALDAICEKYSVKVMLLPLQDIDKPICEEIKNKMTSETITVSEKLTPCEIMEVVSRSCMCIGMRLHMLIYAAAVAVPLVGIVYDQKVSGFMEYVQQELYTEADKLNEKEFLALMDTCMSNRETIKQDLVTIREKLTELAAKNSELAVELYNRK